MSGDAGWSDLEQGLPDPVRHDQGILAKVRYLWILSGLLSRREGIGRSQQLREILELYLARRFGPLMYYQLELWRPSLSMPEKKRFLHNDEVRESYRALNPPAYRAIGQHKLAQKSILRCFGVPTTEVLGHLHVGEGCDLQFRPLTNASELARFLLPLHGQRICFKRTTGSGGHGFVAADVEVRGDEPFLASCGTDTWQDAGSFYEAQLAEGALGGMLIERYLVQHDTVSALNPSSLNTLRVWVLQQGREVRVVGGLLRVGRPGMVVDNSHSGGLIARVDFDTGRVKYLQTGSLFPRRFTHHPDTGVQVQDVQLPHFDACLRLACDAFRVLPESRLGGIDIAIAPDGPFVVEINLTPDPISARDFSAPLGDLLKW